MSLALEGTVCTMDADHRVIRSGVVYVGDDGLIGGIAKASDPAPPGFAAARRVATGGVIYPGLIDLHNHMAYNALPLWDPPKPKYQHHDSWNTGEAYARNVSWPATVQMLAAPEALLKYAQVKALIGGTTAIQGKPKSSRPIDGWLARVIDDESFGQHADYVHVAVIPKSLDDLANEKKRLAHPNAVYIPHVGEGVPGSIVHAEFKVLHDGGCVKQGLIGIHGTSLTASDFAELGGVGGAIAWSPFSNLWLYEVTTDVATARAKHVRICLGSDWAPSGTKHVLGELKVADLLNKQAPAASQISARDLCDLVTANPGDALAVAWGPRIGRLAQAASADIVVCSRRVKSGTDAVYRNLVTARERDVQLVLVGGRPQYGTKALMQVAGAQGAEPIRVAGEDRRIVVRLAGHKDAEMTWVEVLADLARVQANPTGAWDDAQGALADWGGPLDDPDAPLMLIPDMPDGDLGLLGAVREPPADLVIPPPDPLEHDAAFFATTAGRSPLLAALQAYYP